ncbi:tyrosine-protein kinase receptor torso-like isoform X1 [Vespula squamosa]|uniref:Tyrosine-protein kinase receptor torso-like isoform X1 n=1 Tax=Vespula squamosa TaxID=30214 RepID=A0ABD2AF04_VESSQ
MNQEKQGWHKDDVLITMINNYIFLSILLLMTSTKYHHRSLSVNAFQVDDCLALCSNKSCENACYHNEKGSY